MSLVRQQAAIAAGVFGAALTAVLFIGLAAGNLNTGDTNVLVAGVRQALDCLSVGTFTNCRTTETGDALIGPYPLLQFLPATVASLLGLSAEEVIRVLGGLNVLAFAACLALPVVAFDAVRRPERQPRAAVACLAVLVSTAPYQSTAGFGEMLAAAAITLAVTVAHRGWLHLLGPTVLVACLAKETAAPVVVALCLAVATGGRRLPPRRALIAVGAGAGAALLLSALFNTFRYGGPRNEVYLQPLFRTVPDRIPIFAVGEWLSPVAGVAVYWPVATAVLMFGLVVSAKRTGLRTKDGVQNAWTLLATLGVVGATTALATWYSPFGWVAFGPRLAVPLLPAGTLAVLLALPPTGLQGRVSHVPWPLRAAAAATLTTLAWASAGTTWSSPEAIAVLIAAGPGCPADTALVIQHDAEQYYRCTTQYMWRSDGDVYRAAALGGGVAAVPARLLGGLTAAALSVLVLTRREGHHQLPPALEHRPRTAPSRNANRRA